MSATRQPDGVVHIEAESSEQLDSFIMRCGLWIMADADALLHPATDFVLPHAAQNATCPECIGWLDTIAEEHIAEAHP